MRSSISQNAAAVICASGATGAWLSFSRRPNTGNGSEPFRLAVDAAISGDDFDPTSPGDLRERTARRDCRLGAGGDTPYAIGANDLYWCATPVCQSTSPRTSPSDWRKARRDVCRCVRYRAPCSRDRHGRSVEAAFPSPGTAYPGAGDPAAGRRQRRCVVGSTFTRARCVCDAEGGYRVDAASGDAEQDGHVGARSDGRNAARFRRGRPLPHRCRRLRQQHRAGSGRARSAACESRLRGVEPRRLRAYRAGSRPTTTSHRFGSDNTGSTA